MEISFELKRFSEFSTTATSRQLPLAQRDREKSILAISDDMVRECQVIGSAEEVRVQLQERSDLGADIQMLYMPQGTPDEFRTWLSNLNA